MLTRILLANVILVAASFGWQSPAAASRPGMHGHGLRHAPAIRVARFAPSRRHFAAPSHSRQRAVTSVASAAARPTVAPAAIGAQTGRASFYYSGGRTASGGIVGTATCAHRSLPFGTRVLVTNLSNLRRMVLVVNDRGPFVGGRIVDVSRTAAAALGMLQSGIANVRMQVVGGPG